MAQLATLKVASGVAEIKSEALKEIHTYFRGKQLVSQIEAMLKKQGWA